MKPESYITKLIDVISDSNNIKKAKSRQLINMGGYSEPVTLIVHKGMLACYRSSDQLLVKYFQGPLLIGLNELMDIHSDFVVKAYGSVSYEILPRKLAFEIIERENLWKETAYLAMYGTKRFTEAYQSTAGLNTYELIRLNLFALMEEDEELRLTVNASDYIQDKTHISRSRVMKILGDLRTGEHVEIKRGILMKINKLPDKY